MRRIMYIIFGASLAATIFFTAVYSICPVGWYLTCAITFGTIFYHFGVRLAVGTIVSLLKYDGEIWERGWFREFSPEPSIYKAIKVSKWKKFMPTYDPNLFSLAEADYEKIAAEMCRAEVVHEISAFLSFLPLLAIPRFGAGAAFVLTSAAAAVFDILFVIIQRYNRPRIVRVIDKRKGIKNGKI